MSTSDYILSSSKEYAIYVAQNRAIPSVTDGLKDAQRKALWILRNKQDKTKTISLAGEMISANIYLAGDTSAAQALSYLAAPYLNNVPLIQGIGSFGSRVSPVSGIGAPRYTYCKKSKFADAVLYQDMKLVPMKENYDGSVMEPVTFLPLLPLALLNGTSGVAVGWSTEILPRSLEDLKQAVIDVLSGKKLGVIKPHYSYMDVDVKKLEDTNAWEFTGKLERIDASTLRVTELPPGMDLEKFKNHLDKLEDKGSIVTYDDNSTKTIDVTVKFKRGTLKDPFDREGYINLLKLRSRNTERIVVLGWNGKSIQQYEDPNQLITDFVEWRFRHYVGRYELQLKEQNAEMEYLLALKDCFDKGLPNDVLKLKNRKSTEEKVREYTATRTIDDSQLDRIISMPIYRWAEEYYEKLLEDIKNLEGDIVYTKDLLANPNKIKKIYVKEVSAIKI